MLNIIENATKKVFIAKHKDAENLSKINYRVDTEEAKGTLHHIEGSFFSIFYGQLSLSENFSIHIDRKDNHCIRLFFALKGLSKLGIEKGPEHVLECNQHNIFSIPQNTTETLTSGMCNDCNACKEWRFLCIDMQMDAFQKYMDPQSNIFQYFQESVKQNLSINFCPNNLMLDLQIHEILQEIMHIKISQPYEKLLLESLVLKLFATQIGQIENYKCPAISGMRDSDIEKIYKAREILVDCLNEPCPLVELALKVGTNECTLKKGFKEVFGCTVFGYLQELKMQQAKKYLLEGKKSVAEISDEMGYKNPTHFTSAFKKRFGMLPSKMKKS